MAGPATAPPAQNSTPSEGQTFGGSQNFESALRGYDRRQVDEFVAARSREVADLRRELAESQRQAQRATEQAQAGDKELRELKSRSAHSQPASPEDGFGFRAEKLLRLAEQEASEIRGSAVRESAAIVEQARNDAEKHRHETEQSLIARASLLEQQAGQRTAELQDREQQIGDQLAAARQQADQLHEAAVIAADRLREESEAAAEQTRVRANTDAQRRLDKAAKEVTRLEQLQVDVRGELARLAQVLTSELSSAQAAGKQPDQRPGNAAAG